MKLFRKIQKWFENQENLYYLFLIILIVPNIVLCFTEPMPLVAKVCNVLLPFSIYHMIMSWSGNCGKTFWILFPFLFFGAFQIVLLYLFGQSVIAVDMFLNLVTTNPSEALELLDNLIPAIIIVVLLYIPALVDYLKRAHAYFLDFNLPAMRRKLIEAIDCSRDNDVAYLILKFFDEYAKEVRRHMEYENKAVFTYVEQLLQGRLSDVYNIATFASKHNQIDTKLKELKNIIIKYYPEKENNNLLNAVLFDIFNCEQDLASHCQVEDYMFVPAVAQIEKRLKDEQ